MSFPKIPSSPNFFTLQEEILKYWEDNQIFEKSISQRSEDNPYRFYDGPPFKNGLPHYGHALQSTIKDIIPRFWTMKGKRVERKRGWDCHGIYIEQKVQAKLGLTSNKDIEAYGIDKFMKACEDFTNEVNDEWDRFIPNLGRWVDFKNAYQTMNNSYMESVWRVFKNLWDKGLIYKGKRVSMYSTKLNTAISSFEVQADNSYADVADPAITVKFPIIGNDNLKEHEHEADGSLKVVRGVCKNKKGEYLGLYNLEKNRLQTPGGKVDTGETNEQALQREIKEEIGLDCTIIKEIGNFPIVCKNIHHKVYLYEIQVSGDPKSLESKHSEVIYRTFEENNEYPLGRGVKFKDLIIIDPAELYTKYLAQNIIFHIDKIFHSSISFLARTTTPRTIPANLGLVVNPTLTYVQLYDLQAKEHFILTENLVSKYFKDPSQYQIIYKCKGVELEGISYKAPFDYYVGQNDNDFKVYLADYVTDTDGTGIVHTAPEFGEEDFQTGKRNNLTQSEAIDERGCYTNQINDMVGVYYRDANDIVTEKLKALGVLIKKESITHTVPICPRTQVPLIFKTQDSWFINIQSVKKKLIEKCKEINWVPDHMRLGRFLKNIESAPDRCISRTRYWATPMPVWFGYNNDGEIVDTKVIGSLTELEGLSGMKVVDMHRPGIDAITRSEGGITYKRTTEVLDPWMDSGSMPYAQDHYPFEHKEHFEAGFPADFIGEGLGQVRARFYVMHVLGVLLFDTVAYKNVICTGTVLGNDGRKMSKTFGNYPDIKPTIQSYGADSIRMFFANSPLLNGGDQPFTEEHLREIIKKVHLPLWNSFSFFLTYAELDGFTPSKYSINELVDMKFENDLDTWIIGKTANLIHEVSTQMEAYNIQKATSPIYEFITDLTNRYIRRSRRRFRKGEMDAEKMQGYETLFVVLVELCKVLAPFMPFLSDYIFKTLTGKESVHLELWTSPKPNELGADSELLKHMDMAKLIVELGLSLRGSLKLKVKQPLQTLKINKAIGPAYQAVIMEELNVKEVLIDASLDSHITTICVPNARVLGKKLGGRFAEINNLAKSGQFELLSDNTVKASDIILQADEYELRYEKGDLAGDIITLGNLILMLDTTITPELKLEGYARELIRSIQEARKSAGYEISDRIQLSISGFEAQTISNQYGEYIANETLATIVTNITNPDFSGECDVDDGIISFQIKK